MADRSRRVLVTGTDTMLGAAVQTAFEARGDRVVGVCQARGDACRLPPDAVVADFTDPGQIRSAVTDAADLLAGLDTVVTAHALPVVGAVSDLDMTDFWEHVDSALTGTFLVAQAAAASISGGGTPGRMVLTTSRWHVGGPGLSAVATAAGGVVALTKTLTRDLGPFGIGVNAVAVGCVDSEWSICDVAEPAAAVPAGRGTVAQVANLIEVLSRSSLGAAVGQIVNADGGRSRNRV